MAKITPVYFLVGFPFPYVNAQKARVPFERLSTKLYKLRKTGKTDPALEKEVTKISKAYKKKHMVNLALRTVLKGVFKTQKEAVDTVLKYGYDMHEGGYYTYFAVEKGHFGYDCHDYGEPEVWLKGKATGKSFWDYKYEICKRPKEFNGIVGFA